MPTAGHPRARTIGVRGRGAASRAAAGPRTPTSRPGQADDLDTAVGAAILRKTDRIVRPVPSHYRGRVRLTYFRELMEGEFGAVRAAAVSHDHVFAQLGGRTVEQALQHGVDPREVWMAVCDAYDVPPARR